MLVHQRHDLLHDEQDEKKTARSEERVVETEEELELERWPVLHPCLNTEDDDEVCGEGREHLLRRRKRRLALHIVRQVVRDPERLEREGREQEIREGSHGGRGRRGEKMPTLPRPTFSVVQARAFLGRVRHHPAKYRPILRSLAPGASAMQPLSIPLDVSAPTARPSRDAFFARCLCSQ